SMRNIGAGIMGRGMFGPIGGGDWGDGSWTGWWGEEPPFRCPVFVVTHHPREPVEMRGGTTYHFVTDGIESALEQARRAAGGKDVMVWGGGDVVRQYLAAGLLDELELHVVPMLLGGGSLPLDDRWDAGLRVEQLRGVQGQDVAHLQYRISRQDRPELGPGLPTGVLTGSDRVRECVAADHAGRRVRGRPAGAAARTPGTTAGRGL